MIWRRGPPFLRSSDLHFNLFGCMLYLFLLLSVVGGCSICRGFALDDPLVGFWFAGILAAWWVWLRLFFLVFFCFEELLLVVLAVVVRSWFMLFSVFGVLGAIIFLLSGTFYLPLFLLFFIPSSDINKICFAELKKKNLKAMRCFWIAKLSIQASKQPST